MFRPVFTAISVALCTALPLSAQSVEEPAGPVILTVSGNVASVDAGEALRFDLEMLEAFEKSTIETSTIWTEGRQVFEGVSLATLVRELGITGTTLRATAINDYAVEVPVTDAVEGGPIVAYRLNSEIMSVRDKGPLWIIYPYDAGSDYRTEVIYSRSIWQLDRLEAID